MKSLRKTFDILEYVMVQNGRAITPSEAAKAAELNLATCARIMGKLAERGYLYKVSRKEGYIAGGVIYSLANRKNVWHNLRAAAVEPVNRLAGELVRPVNLSILDGDKRIMLYYSGADERWQPWPQLFFDGYYDTATGRLLLATAEPEIVEKIWQRFGAPGTDVWPEVTSLATLQQELTVIRRDKHVCFPSADKQLWIAGHLLALNGFPAAAIGFGDWIDQTPETVLDKSFRTIEKIRTLLSNNQPIF